MNKQWENVFNKEGKIFEKPHDDMKKISKELKKRNVQKILDLGSGSGRHLIYLSELGFEVFGIDISETGIKMSRDMLNKKGLKANLKVGNIYDRLPYTDEFFDSVISVQAMHHSNIDNIRSLIKEIERVLRPKGVIFITVPKTKKSQRKTKKYKEIEPRTFVPLDGWEKGLPHFLFNEGLIRKEFSNFKINKIWLDSTKHYCFMGELK